MRGSVVALLAAGACVTLAAQTPVEFRVGPEQARWEFAGNQWACELGQGVPNFGRVRFLHEAGTPLVFELLPYQPLFVPGLVTISTHAPAWHPDHPRETVLGSLRHDGAEFRVEQQLARRLLEGLYRGEESRFAQAGVAEVSLSAVNFQPLFGVYGECTSGLSPATFDAVERTALRFPTSGDQIPGAAVERLQLLAEYCHADPEVVAIYVDGHTDNVGGEQANLALSKRRAENVTGFLVAQGLDPDMITTRYHGARYPVSANDSEQGRARNRRTTVRLEKDG